jgi:hypothetical protein
MNKHTPPQKAKALAQPAESLGGYETDFHRWTVEQSALLRAGKFKALDLENLAEEIETLGRTEKREIESRLEVLILHLLKWEYQPSRRSRSWTLTIRIQRKDLLETLDENPSLRDLPKSSLQRTYNKARLAAEKETGLDFDTFPEACPFTIEQIMDEAFPSE